MPKVCNYNPAERQQEKERSRASDALQLRRGDVSQGDLREQTSFFGSLDLVGSSIICQEVFA